MSFQISFIFVHLTGIFLNNKKCVQNIFKKPDLLREACLVKIIKPYIFYGALKTKKSLHISLKIRQD